ncbi:Fe-only/vanadium nitrogenase subunit delta [Clostridium pasteurianum]|uniref:nitrogenase n=1 Tax=Clostridium pasteurianum BC1 TaxID=86416 RepID=R4K522_CLOPA|nr:Fe-only/vanadium nitrogenase subunit delta [Clostridium pasteurianum]AGK98262.1 Vanadium/alternative nitrogenase delta subunit [Clostridium pasteurianum BC1]
MEKKIDEILEFIQERCLWQFHSREWDRTENINGVFDLLPKLLAGEKISTKELEPKEKCFYADAKILSDQLQERFSFVKEMDEKEKSELLSGVKEKLVDVAITKCRNEELRTPFY